MAEFLTVKEVAEKLNLSLRGVQALCRAGKIGSSRPGKAYLIPPESLDEYLQIRR
jgi:excisionase family DNA binding protein